MLPIETTKLYITNYSGADQQWQITRVKESVPTKWDDDICSPLFCFTATGDSYTTPNTAGNPAPVIVNGTNLTDQSVVAELKPKIHADLSVAANATYKYYIVDASNGTLIDSLSLRYNFPLSIDDVTPQLTLSFAPNQANGFVKIETNGANGVTIKMVDVLGNVVLKETIIEPSKTINTESFRNGIYFIQIEADNQQTINR